MLCNKADVDEARDEVHIVNTLQVERLVNEARFINQSSNLNLKK